MLVLVERAVDADAVALVPPVVLDDPGPCRLSMCWSEGGGSRTGCKEAMGWLRNRGLDTVGEEGCKAEADHCRLS